MALLMKKDSPFFSPRLFDDFFNDFLPENAGEMLNWQPHVDIYEEEDKFLVEADLPGVEEKDIKLEYEDGYLTLMGEKKFDKEDKKDRRVARERFFGHFQRTFKLGDQVQADNIKANLKNGTLTIELPKSEKKKAKVIPILNT